MRHDLTDERNTIPLKRFTWGYELRDSRWWLYWELRMPGRAWRVHYDYSRDSVAPCWCSMVLTYRKFGFRDDFGRGARYCYRVDYVPIESP